jgi:hypothetical protein
VTVGLLGNVIQRTTLGNTKIDFFSTMHNGRILTTSREEGTVREYDQKGKLLWELKGRREPTFARRLADGGLVVSQVATSENPAIISYTASGEVAWDFSPTSELGSVKCAAVLANGNALLGTATGLYEIRGGRLARTWINGQVTFIYAN